MGTRFDISAITMFGLLNIDKPAGLTSRDVVNRVQRLVRPQKVGHAGTLDPLATGVLVVAVGAATRLVEYVQRMRKTYRGVFILGRTSDTEDASGTIVALPDAMTPTRDEIDVVIPKFVGTIQQRPPAFSALKVAGKRAYAMARRGDAVELAARPVEIFAIQIVRYEYPELELRIECGSGTYVRSLGRDIAEELGTGAVMSALVRLAVGPFRAAEGLPVDQLTVEVIEKRIISPCWAIGELPQVVVDGEEASRLRMGQSIVNRFGVSGEEVAALDGAGGLMGILVPAGRLELRPVKCFASPEKARPSR
jgi:tRNA pseudouridine55 synthase